MRQYVLVVLLTLFLPFNAAANSYSIHQNERNGTTAKVGVERTTTASWYKQGIKTASGERYNPNDLTVAHKTLPFGTIVKFTNPKNNKVVYARVNDRGPYIKGREFDLSMKCAILLDFKNEGVVKLKVKVIS
jgi:rare lipoprotein A